MEITIDTLISLAGLFIGGGGAFFMWRWQRRKAKAEAQTEEVNIVSRAASLSSEWYLFIPRAQDINGKTLTIHHTGNNITADIIIRQVDYVAPDGGYAGNNPFYAGDVYRLGRDNKTRYLVNDQCNATAHVGQRYDRHFAFVWQLLGGTRKILASNII